MNQTRPGVFVDPTSVIEEPVQIGPGTKIWHFCHVMPGAVIGAGCVIGQNVFIAGRARLGNNVKVQNNVSVYDAVILEDDVFCGPSMVFTNVRTPRSHVPRKREFEETRVMRGATIGANATIMCGLLLGRYCFVGAGAVVTRDVPEFAIMVGNPTRRIGWACRCGVKLVLRGDVHACGECGATYVESDGLLSER